MLLVIIMSFSILSTTVMAAETSGSGANDRTRSMLSYFRKSRTELATDAVSTDELQAYGVFLSNFMIPGATKLGDMFSADSDLTKKVSQIFFGSDGNAETIGKLNSLLQDGIMTGGGLAPIQYKTSTGTSDLDMSVFIKMLAGKETARDLYYANLEHKLVNVGDSNFRTAVCLVTAASITYSYADNKDVLGTMSNSTYDKADLDLRGILGWYGLSDEVDGNGKLYVDGLGNFWYDEKGNNNAADYVLFIPACLQGFVYEKAYTQKLPLVNSFAMGAITKLKTSAITNEDGALQNFMELWGNHSKLAHPTQGVIITAVEQGLLNPDVDSDDVLYGDNKTTGLSDEASNNHFLYGVEASQSNANRTYVMIYSTWNDLFGLASTADNFLFKNILSSAEASGKGALAGLSDDDCSNFLFYFLLENKVKLNDCITNMTYFNLGSTSQYVPQNTTDNVSWDSGSATSSNDVFTDSMYYTEGLFSGINDSDISGYHTVENSAFMNMMIAINEELHGADVTSSTNIVWGSAPGPRENLYLTRRKAVGKNYDIDGGLEFCEFQNLGWLGTDTYGKFDGNLSIIKTQSLECYEEQEDGTYTQLDDGTIESIKWYKDAEAAEKANNKIYVVLNGSKEVPTVPNLIGYLRSCFNDKTSKLAGYCLIDAINTDNYKIFFNSPNEITIKLSGNKVSKVTYTINYINTSDVTLPNFYSNNDTVARTCCMAHRILYQIYYYSKDVWAKGDSTSEAEFMAAMNTGLGYRLLLLTVFGCDYFADFKDSSDATTKVTYEFLKLFASKGFWTNLDNAYFANEQKIYFKIDGKSDICKGLFLTSFHDTRNNNNDSAWRNFFNHKGYADDSTFLSTFPLSNENIVNFVADFSTGLWWSNVSRNYSVILGYNDIVNSAWSTSAVNHTSHIEPENHGKWTNETTNSYTSAKITKNLQFLTLSLYNYRLVSMRNNLYNALSTTYNNDNWGQFVADRCNVWPSIYWSYMVAMLDLKVENGVTTNTPYSSCNGLLPSMLLATSGEGLDLWGDIDSDVGEDSIEDMSTEEKQENLLNKAMLLLSTETSTYRDNWFKSMIDSWIISAHKSIIGTYTNSDMALNMGVESGSTTYASVTGYISTPQLTDLEATSWVINQYGMIYVIMLLIAFVYSFALVITGTRGFKEGIATLCILAVVLVFPQVLLNNSIALMNTAGDWMYADRFNFWAIAKHQSSVNALADASSSSTADYIVASNIEMAKQVYSTDQGVRIKWNSPKKLSAFNSMFSDSVDNSSSSVNLTIFKTLFNSYFNQEEYVYDDMATYMYRPYNAIAGEAKSYYSALKDGIMSGTTNNTIDISSNTLLGKLFDNIKSRYYIDSGITANSEIYSISSYDSQSLSDNISKNIRINPAVALSAMLDDNVNTYLTYKDWTSDTADTSKEKGIPENDVTSASAQLYLAYSESEFYYFYNVLKSQWGDLAQSTDSGSKVLYNLKDAMLEDYTFETAYGSRSYIRDFLGMEYLFEYVIPYINEGNEYVKSYINKYGMKFDSYDFSSDKVKLSNTISEDGEDEQLAADYLEAMEKKQEEGQVWLLYSSWVDQLYDATSYEKVKGHRINPLEPISYENALGRDMVFSEVDMLGTVDTDTYAMHLSYGDLSSVEIKIMNVLKNTYEDIMYLNNYWNYDEEVILTAAAMMATFNFNREFSKYTLLGESNIIYPQNFELKNFNYDAFLRLIIMNSTGESLIDKSDLYTRVIGKTSVVAGILLLLVDITAVIVIPALKLLILLLILILGLAMCLTCVSIDVKEIPKKVWTCLIKPIVFFALSTVGFAWGISLFVGTGLTAYVGSSSISIATNDPTITFLLILLVNVVYIVLMVKIFLFLFKTVKQEIKGTALAVVGAVAGAASVVGGKIVRKAKGMGNGMYGNGIGYGNGYGGMPAQSKSNKDKAENNLGNDNDLDGDEKRKKSGSLLNDDLRSNSDSSEDSEVSKQKKAESAEETVEKTKGKSATMNDMSSDKEEKKETKKEVKKAEKTKAATSDAVKKPKESIGSRAATAYMDVGTKLQAGALAVSDAYHTAKMGVIKTGASIKRTGKALVDRKTYETMGKKAVMGATAAGEAVRDTVVDGAKAVGKKAVDIKDKALEYGEKAVTTVKDTVIDTKQQFDAAGELLAENWEQKKDEHFVAHNEQALRTAVEITNKDNTRTQMIAETDDKWDAFIAKHSKKKAKAPKNSSAVAKSTTEEKQGKE